MGRSMAPVSRPSELARAPRPVRIPKGKQKGYFEVFGKGPDLYQAEGEEDSQGRTIYRREYRLDYVVGAGLNGYTYLFRRGNELFEAPLTFYTRSGKWDLSPAYDVHEHGFGRPIFPPCLSCHNGQPRPVPQSDGQYHEPPFRFGEMAMSCEACHGPGELHAAKWSRGGEASGLPDASIVNPSRLTRRVADDVCRYCHQGGDTVVLQPGRNLGDFRPGEPLYRTLAIIKMPLGAEQREEANRLETLPPVRGTVSTPQWWKNSLMELSKCYTATQGKLNCLTCHEIHKRPDDKQKVAYFRDKCLSCHGKSACSLTASERRRQSPQDDCVGCHMPKRGMAIAHTASTSHRIVRRAGQPLPDSAFEPGPPELDGLIYLNGPEDGGRSLPPLAKLAIYGALLNRNPALRRSYETVQDELSKSDPDNPVVLASLGRDALQRHDPNAVKYLSRAFELNKEFPTTLLAADLAEALAAVGRSEEAAHLLERALERSPYASILYKSLMLRYAELRQAALLEAITRKYLDIFPGDAEIRALLQRLEKRAH
jgi:hypothetical protein